MRLVESVKVACYLIATRTLANSHTTYSYLPTYLPTYL